MQSSPRSSLLPYIFCCLLWNPNKSELNYFARTGISRQRPVATYIRKQPYASGNIAGPTAPAASVMTWHRP